MTEPIAVKGALRRLHMGPGDHPSGSPQDVHAGDGKGTPRQRTTRWLERNVQFDFRGCRGGIGENCAELDALKQAMIEFEDGLGYRIENLLVTDNAWALVYLLYPGFEEDELAKIVPLIRSKMRNNAMSFLTNTITGDSAFYLGTEVLDRNKDTINLQDQSQNWFFVAYHELGHYLQRRTGVTNLPVKDWQELLKTDIYKVYNKLGYPNSAIDDELRSDFLAAYIQANGDFESLKLSTQRFPDYEIEDAALDLFKREFTRLKDAAKREGITTRAKSERLVHVEFPMFGGMTEIIPIQESDVPDGKQPIEDLLVDAITRGGPGSGHFGHAGRPGKVGGSQSSKQPIPDVKVPEDRGGGWWQDNPQQKGFRDAAEWLKQNPNTPTAGYNEAKVDPRDIVSLSGARGEQDFINWEKVARLAESMKVIGMEYKPLIIIEQDRTAYIWEGNHRVRAAIEAGLETITVEIRYFGGSEELEGIWKPELKAINVYRNIGTEAKLQKAVNRVMTALERLFE